MEEYYNYKKFDFSELYKNKKIDERLYFLLNEYFSRRMVEMDFSEEELKKDVEKTMGQLNSIAFKENKNRNSNGLAYYRSGTKSLVLYRNKCFSYSLFDTLSHELGHIKDNKEVFSKSQYRDDYNKIEGNNSIGTIKKIRMHLGAFKKTVIRDILWSSTFREIYAENKAYRINSSRNIDYEDSETISTSGYSNITPIMVIMSNISGVSIKELLKKSEKDISFEKIVLDNCDDKIKAQYYIDTMAANVYMLNKIHNGSNLANKEDRESNYTNSIDCIHKASVGILTERMKVELPNMKNEELEEYIEKIKFCINSININLEECASYECDNFSDINNDCGVYIKKVIDNLDKVKNISELSNKDELDNIFTVSDEEIIDFKKSIDRMEVTPYYDISDKVKEKCLELKKVNRYDNSQIIKHIDTSSLLARPTKKNKIFDFLKQQKNNSLYLQSESKAVISQNKFVKNLEKLVVGPKELLAANDISKKSISKNSHTKDENIDNVNLK